jgi:hypothetical protein
MSERRLTPEEVKAAYEATGAEPRRSLWVRPKNLKSFTQDCGDAKACGLGVMYLKEKQPALISQEHSPNEAKAYAELALGHEYVNGFISGFDSGHEITSPGYKGRQCQGFCDGKAAAELVFNPQPEETSDDGE